MTPSLIISAQSIQSMPPSMLKYALGGAIASYFGYRGHRSRSSPPPFPDRAKAIYPAIDWKTSAIGGSYALHQFRGNIKPSSWEPHDIDVFIGCKNDEEFEQAVQAFEKRCPEAKISDIRDRYGYRYGETFNQLVRGSRVYHHPDAGIIDLVHVQTPDGRGLQSVLAETTDAPGGLSYTIEKRNAQRTKIWHLTDKGREAILTGWVNEQEIGSALRREKYEKRGFSFYRTDESH